MPCFSGYEFLQQISQTANSTCLQPLVYQGRRLTNSCLFLPDGRKMSADIAELHPMLVTFIQAGYGHAIEAAAVATSLCALGFPVILLDLWDIVQGEDAASLQKVTGIYERFQRSRLARKLNRYFPVPLLLLKWFPAWFSKREARLGPQLEAALADWKVRRVIATHSFGAGALSSGPFADKTVNLIPDPFGVRGAVGMACMGRLHVTNTAFDQKHVQLLRAFGLEQVELLETPIPSDVMDWIVADRARSVSDPEQARYTRRRWEVFTGTSGAGSNWQEIEAIMRGITPELLKADSAFLLRVFVGAHAHLLDRATRLAQELGILDSEHFELIYCKNLIEIGLVKYWLQASSEIVLEKAGEPALIVPWLGSQYISLGFTSPHEYGNLLTAKARYPGVRDLPRQIDAATLLTFFHTIRTEIEQQLKSSDYRSRQDALDALFPLLVSTDAQTGSVINRREQQDDFLRQLAGSTI
ncbi:MAG TPA: hypothetical protein PKL83_05835 [bacterium]|nr:hypothetical protein [bacterium]